MKLCDYTVPELNEFRKNCNFVNEEIVVFEKRAAGVTVEEIAESMSRSVDNIYKISSKINRKIERFQKKKPHRIH